ncbi:MAG: CotH kinase family protein [Vicinamibacterales bacterium]
MRLAQFAVALACLACGAPAERPEERQAARRNQPPEPLPEVRLDLGGQSVGDDDTVAGLLRIAVKDQPATESRVVIELQGDTSRTLAKKSYQLELVDDQEDERDLPLLGMPAHSDWVLHSCGFDPTCMRNALAYGLAKQFGHYAPRTRFVELFVDDAYDGLYVLVERIRRGRERVDLPRPAATENRGDISGGYLFRMDLGEGEPGDRIPRDWVSPVTSTIYSYAYPRHDDITGAQKSYLHDHVTRFETLIRGDAWNDPQAGYRQVLDLPSWIDFALLQELSLNVDAYHKSIYLQKWPAARGHKLAIGPIWDFDLAFGTVEFRDARNTQTWAHTRNRFGGEPVPYSPPGRAPYVPEYWERLWSDPGFQGDLRCRWQELRGGPLQLESLAETIDAWTRQLSPALARDAARWPDLPKSNYRDGIVLLKDFLAARLAWMDANLPGTCAPR